MHYRVAAGYVNWLLACRFLVSQSAALFDADAVPQVKIFWRLRPAPLFSVDVNASCPCTNWPLCRDCRHLDFMMTYDDYSTTRISCSIYNDCNSLYFKNDKCTSHKPTFLVPGPLNAAVICVFANITLVNVHSACRIEETFQDCFSVNLTLLMPGAGSSISLPVKSMLQGSTDVLTVEVSYDCSDGPFFGPGCAIRCDPPAYEKGQYYNCDPSTGFKVCHQGYSGDSCSIPCELTTCPKNDPKFPFAVTEIGLFDWSSLVSLDHYSDCPCANGTHYVRVTVGMQTESTVGPSVASHWWQIPSRGCNVSDFNIPRLPILRIHNSIPYDAIICVNVSVFLVNTQFHCVRQEGFGSCLRWNDFIIYTYSKTLKNSLEYVAYIQTGTPATVWLPTAILVKCPANYVGLSCSWFCPTPNVARNECFTTCDPLTGKRVCCNGFTGENCDQLCYPQCPFATADSQAKLPLLILTKGINISWLLNKCICDNTAIVAVRTTISVGTALIQSNIPIGSGCRYLSIGPLRAYGMLPCPSPNDKICVRFDVQISHASTSCLAQETFMAACVAASAVLHTFSDGYSFNLTGNSSASDFITVWITSRRDSFYGSLMNSMAFGNICGVSCSAPNVELDQYISPRGCNQGGNKTCFNGFFGVNCDRPCVDAECPHTPSGLPGISSIHVSLTNANLLSLDTDHHCACDNSSSHSATLTASYGLIKVTRQETIPNSCKTFSIISLKVSLLPEAADDQTELCVNVRLTLTNPSKVCTTHTEFQSCYGLASYQPGATIPLYISSTSNISDNVMGSFLYNCKSLGYNYGFFGPGCAVNCTSPLFSAGQNYKCDYKTGSKLCSQGFFGPNCDHPFINSQWSSQLLPVTNPRTARTQLELHTNGFASLDNFLDASACTLSTTIWLQLAAFYGNFTQYLIIGPAIAIPTNSATNRIVKLNFNVFSAQVIQHQLDKDVPICVMATVYVDAPCSYSEVFRACITFPRGLTARQAWLSSTRATTTDFIMVGVKYRCDSYFGDSVYYGFFGDYCSVECGPPNVTAGECYTCDSNGRKVCCSSFCGMKCDQACSNANGNLVYSTTAAISLANPLALPGMLNDYCLCNSSIYFVLTAGASNLSASVLYTSTLNRGWGYLSAPQSGCNIETPISTLLKVTFLDPFLTDQMLCINLTLTGDSVDSCRTVEKFSGCTNLFNLLPDQKHYIALRAETNVDPIRIVLTLKCTTTGTYGWFGPSCRTPCLPPTTSKNECYSCVHDEHGIFSLQDCCIGYYGNTCSEFCQFNCTNHTTPQPPHASLIVLRDILTVQAAYPSSKCNNILNHYVTLTLGVGNQSTYHLHSVTAIGRTALPTANHFDINLPAIMLHVPGSLAEKLICISINLASVGVNELCFVNQSFQECVQLTMLAPYNAFSVNLPSMDISSDDTISVSFSYECPVFSYSDDSIINSKFGFMGFGCDTLCPKPNRALGECFTCDLYTGQRICCDGYYGGGCNEQCSAKQPCGKTTEQGFPVSNVSPKVTTYGMHSTSTTTSITVPSTSLSATTPSLSDCTEISRSSSIVSGVLTTQSSTSSQLPTHFSTGQTVVSQSSNYNLVIGLSVGGLAITMVTLTVFIGWRCRRNLKCWRSQSNPAQHQLELSDIDTSQTTTETNETININPRNRLSSETEPLLPQSSSRERSSSSELTRLLLRGSSCNTAKQSEAEDCIELRNMKSSEMTNDSTKASEKDESGLPAEQTMTEEQQKQETHAVPKKEFWLDVVSKQVSRKREQRYSCSNQLQMCEGLKDHEMQDVECDSEVCQTLEPTSDESPVLFNIASPENRQSASSISTSSSTASLLPSLSTLESPLSSDELTKWSLPHISRDTATQAKDSVELGHINSSNTTIETNGTTNMNSSNVKPSEMTNDRTEASENDESGVPVYFQTMTEEQQREEIHAVLTKHWVFVLEHLDVKSIVQWFKPGSISALAQADLANVHYPLNKHKRVTELIDQIRSHGAELEFLQILHAKQKYVYDTLFRKNRQ